MMKYLKIPLPQATKQESKETFSSLDDRARKRLENYRTKKIAMGFFK